MPELPEVESVRRQLAPELTSRTITKLSFEPQRRFQRVDLARGRTVSAVNRRGKYLVCPLDRDLELILHLGMTGSFRFDHADQYARARFLLDDGRELIFRDPRRFGQVAVVERGDYRTIPSLHSMGPEPLSASFEPGAFARALARSSAPVKAQLLSQRPVAGVGNIYADEALWRARINPRARRVGRVRAHRLHGDLISVLSSAIEREGTTFRDYQMINGESGRYAEYLDAYGRAELPCRRCGTAMRRIIVAGRGTTYCPRCQRQ